jgi:putative flippase GtrA
MKSKPQAFSRLLSLIDKRTLAFFLTVGASSAIFYFLSFTLLYGVMHWNYKVAVTIAYLISVLTHFLGNRFLTFQSHGSHFWRQLIRYITMVLINYGVTLMVMHAVVVWLKLVPYFGVAASIAATAGTGYLMSKFWVFTKPSTHNEYQLERESK